WLRTNSREAGVSPGPCGISQRISALVPWSTKCCGGSGLQIRPGPAASASRGARVVAESMGGAYPTRLIDFAFRVQQVTRVVAGTKDDPWSLSTAPGTQDHRMYGDEGADLFAICGCRIGGGLPRS